VGTLNGAPDRLFSCQTCLLLYHTSKRGIAMSDRLQERAAVEFEHYVIGLHNSVPDREGTAKACVPWSRHGLRFTQSEIPGLVREIRNVLRARALFAQAAPGWAPLPVGDEITPLLHATGGMCLLGHYACSLMMLNYDYLGHPSFYDYGCGVLAHPRAPNHVRDDPELQAKFPARELPGLCGRLVWFGEHSNKLIGV
jgi:hypothetical protein